MSDEGPGCSTPAALAQREAWAAVDLQLRRRTVRLLRSRLPLADQDALRAEIRAGADWSTTYPGWGTEVREMLRANIAADEDLPGDGWIDLWAGAVEEAVVSPRVRGF